MENFVLIGVFVLLGMLFRRFKTFPKDSAQVLNLFALYVSLPALILLKAPQIVFSREIVIAALVPWGMLLFSLLVLVGARLLHWERSTLGVLLLVVPLGNTSFLGIPMIQSFFGAAGLPYLIIYDQIGTMMIMGTYGSFILAMYGKDRSTKLAAVIR
jgi:predicted permease